MASVLLKRHQVDAAKAALRSVGQTLNVTIGDNGCLVFDETVRRDLIDAMTDYLVAYGLDEADEPTADGLAIEEIIDALATPLPPGYDNRPSTP